MRARACAWLVCLAGASVTLGQATWTVDDDGGADFTDIQPAIEASADGDTVLVYPGTYSGIDMLGKAIEVRSAEGPELTVVVGDGFKPALNCGHGEGRGTVLRGLGFTRGVERLRGPAWQIDLASPTIVGCVLRDWHEPGWRIDPAPVFVNVGGPLFEGCRFENNAGDDGGAVFAMTSAVVLTGCVFERNVTLSYQGAALAVLSGVVRVEGCRFEGNRGEGGGGAHLSNTTATVERCEFLGNGGGLEGGAVRTHLANLTMVDCVLEANDAYHGGGLMIDDGTVVIAHTRFVGNTAFRRGGGVTNAGDLTLTGCEIVGNSAERGDGAIEDDWGMLTLGDTRICGNGPDSVGGPWTDLGGNCVMEYCERCDCPADWDMDGAVNSADVIAYLDDWAQARGDADINADGVIDTRDFIMFLGAWSAGC